MIVSRTTAVARSRRTGMAGTVIVMKGRIGHCLKRQEAARHGQLPGGNLRDEGQDAEEGAQAPRATIAESCKCEETALARLATEGHRGHRLNRSLRVSGHPEASPSELCFRARLAATGSKSQSSTG